MALRLNEPVIRALVERLQSGVLTGAVAEINAESPGAASDGYTIAAPATVYPFIPPPTMLGNLSVAAPIYGVEDLSSWLEDDLGHSATGAHPLATVVFVANPAPEALAWQIRRHVRAAATAIHHGGAPLGAGGASTQDGAWGITKLRADYGPKLRHPSNADDYVTWAAVSFEARREE